MQAGKCLKPSRLIFISSLAVCGLAATSQPSRAQSAPFMDPAKIQRVDAEDDRRAKRDRDEVVDDAYVYYLTQVKKFDARTYSVAQVKEEAAGHAAKVEALVQADSQFRTQKLGSFLRDPSVQMTVGELIDALNNAEKIIKGDTVSAQAQNMSYFVQGDVDDWKNRTARLDANDGFILPAPHEYALLFNRAQGEKHLLEGYSKGNGGKMLPASVITPLHDQISALLAKMNALAASHSFSGIGKTVEPFIVGFLRKEAPGNIAGATVLKSSWLNSPWLIDKNALGIPVRRRRLGTVLYRVPNQKFLIEQHFFYHEAYAGGGKYARGADVNFADLRFVKS